MGGTTVRFTSDRKRGPGRGGWRRWLALLLGLLAVAGALTLFTRDVNWRARSHEAKRRAVGAYHNGNYEAARDAFIEALENNPYDWESHHRLAGLLNHRLNDPEGALRHYLYTMAYSPDSDIVEPTKREINILRLIRSGELENPVEAIEDMFQSVESNAPKAFMRRLEEQLRRDGDAYWHGWTQRGRGTVVWTKITSNHEGLYDAAVGITFPDETAMLLHMQCPLRDIWRVDLSFP